MQALTNGSLPNKTPLVATLLACLVAGGCANEIGDSCSTNVDCSPTGDRICDTAQHEGYCTVEGCGPTTCPDEAACIRFFPAAFLSKPCDPHTEDAVDPKITATNDCDPEEICLSGGFCAQFSLERRFCMKPCSDNSDCREGYECRATGTAGAEPLLDRERPEVRTVRFCAQALSTGGLNAALRQPLSMERPR